MKAMKLRTVLLFVPADRPEFFRKACRSAADTIIFDLEDAVAPSKKEESRHLLERELSRGLPGEHREIAVRVNALSTPWGADDLEMVSRRPEIDVVILPKSEPGAVRLTGRFLDDAHHALICLIETARGLQLAYDTLRASERVSGAMLGAEDLTLDMNMRRTPEGAEIDFARKALALAAYAAGVQPIDTPYPQVDDLDGLRRDTRRAREMGFTAKAALSPRQIAVIREVFRPGPEELQEAQRIVRAAEDAEIKGLSMVALDGAMIDAPVVARARRVVALAGEADGK